MHQHDPKSSPQRSPITGHTPNKMLTFFACVILMAQGTAAIHHMKRPALAWVSPRDSSVPLVVSNLCTETIYPGILTQSGTSPSSSGFKLNSGDSKNLTVGSDWQGRVWGRTNCSFNPQGTGPANTGGLDGNGQACGSGDCNGVVNCQVTVRISPSQRPQSRYIFTDTTHRAKPPSPSPNSPSPPAAAKPSTTSPWSTATTSPSPSSPCTRNPTTPNSLTSPPT